MLPPAARAAAAPLLFCLDGDGKLALLNYRVEGETYVADRVASRLVLVAGGGSSRRDERIEIVNRDGRAGRARADR